jgi:Na+(H+)/acetate symporter ActP
MLASILSIIASILGLVATWFVSKKAVMWLQWYRTKKQQAEVEAARQAAQDQNQRLNDQIRRNADAAAKTPPAVGG